MATRRYSAALVLVALAPLAGCGGSQTTQSTKSQTAAAAQPSNPLVNHVLRAGEFPGYTTRGAPTVVSGADPWIDSLGLPPAQVAPEKARLRRLGFVAGIAEHLNATSGNPTDALSVVEQFSTPKAASTELVTQIKPPPQAGPQTSYTVAGIPGAKAFDASGNGGSGHNVLFTSGPYFYLVGAGWPQTNTHPPSRAVVTAAAVTLYKRVSGK